MKASEAFEKNRAFIREAAARHRVANPRVFGSVLHQTDGRDSDIDILVDYLPETTLADLGLLQEELECKLGVRVDVVPASGLHRFIKDRVIAEAQPV
jgi:predicted nucleotidyltransferase